MIVSTELIIFNKFKNYPYKNELGIFLNLLIETNRNRKIEKKKIAYWISNNKRAYLWMVLARNTIVPGWKVKWDNF